MCYYPADCYAYNFTTDGQRLSLQRVPLSGAQGVQPAQVTHNAFVARRALLLELPWDARQVL